ncbi:mitochondrial fission ELM1 family protein [Persicirhabdus sediminis]|uniref:Mitochondrial fission ELM1 family protein n=1 Tax=Persicirhabdus sediminis TaxID=454144 RepID=A0A8J7MDA6_9BACT|nr:ELM1/GtrOC1 family putative glycosyltransferase [Persicirhabdus sediminis]MBK1790516.1 mitochondrial fission ELM1 family protein [Persicirhabdus sediminis]
MIHVKNSLWILSDGKLGHQNQSLGLAEALANQFPPEQKPRIEITSLSGWLWQRLCQVRRASRAFDSPPIAIIAAGHKTHLPLMRAASKLKAPSILLMKPSLPCKYFDHCLVPEHDLLDKTACPNTITTKGALNRVPAHSQQTAIPKENLGLVLLGGESKEFTCDSETLASQLQEIANHSDIKQWQVTDSRRSPVDLLCKIDSSLYEKFPHQETNADWLPSQLSSAKEVWVTRDSISMIYEALSSGAKVGLLPMPRKNKDSRVSRGVDELLNDKFLTSFEEWQQTRQLHTAPHILSEASRCAELLYEKLALKPS